MEEATSSSFPISSSQVSLSLYRFSLCTVNVFCPIVSCIYQLKRQVAGILKKGPLNLDRVKFIDQCLEVMSLGITDLFF